MLKIFFVLAAVAAVNAKLLGSGSHCMYGPSYWCESFEKADECGATKHCMERVWTQKNELTDVFKDSDACTFCKDMVTDLRNLLTGNETRATIERYVNMACNYMPDQFSQQECKKIELHYLDQFLDLIEKNLNPDTICVIAQLCNKGRQVKSDVVKSAALSPSKIFKVALTKPVKSGDNSVACDTCKAFFSLVAKQLQDQKIQDELKSLMLNECSQLAGQMASECKTLVNTYFPALIPALIQELEGGSICSTLTLCSSVSHADLIAELKGRLLRVVRGSGLVKGIQVVAARLNNQECDTCEEIAGYAKIFLSNNATEQELSQLLQTEVCAQLGGLKDTCDQLVQQYLPQLYARLLQLLDPATICTDLGLCTNSSSVKKPVQKTPLRRVKASPTCIICEFVMSKLDDMLEDNATEEEIVQAVEKVCTILPSSVRSECDNLIEKYGHAIINLLIHDATPSVICGFLGLCATNERQYIMPTEDYCMVCEVAMSYLQSMLEKNATEDEIEQILEKICNYLGGDLAQQCNSLVEKYGADILKMLANDIQPKEICTRLGLCKAKKIKADGLVHLYNRVIPRANV